MSIYISAEAVAFNLTQFLSCSDQVDKFCVFVTSNYYKHCCSILWGAAFGRPFKFVLLRYTYPVCAL